MRAILSGLLIVTLAGCGGESRVLDEHPDHVVRFSPAGTELRVHIADSDSERQLGLMGVRRLPANQGMAFLWDRPVSATFWMSNTLIPLSIAFVGDDGRIVAIRTMEPCRTDSCPRYESDAPFTTAIEANAGYFTNQGIAVGDQAILEPRDD
jgi:uncharacterized membrane protein (UPF0127 family)